ncbi:hypothetical protein EYF80_016041 [Liparis tanakae]|uniref:Uncharacterized protein n=1 Tax=Liparis tanakae TaxID=230148 RepID=A0A4Z2I7B3_9TELE|nr:hypothetical protein EYF80_016041 [Liparis tanakae]
MAEMHPEPDVAVPSKYNRDVYQGPGRTEPNPQHTLGFQASPQPKEPAAHLSALHLHLLLRSSNRGQVFAHSHTALHLQAARPTLITALLTLLSQGAECCSLDTRSTSGCDPCLRSSGSRNRPFPAAHGPGAPFMPIHADISIASAVEVAGKPFGGN